MKLHEHEGDTRFGMVFQGGHQLQVFPCLSATLCAIVDFRSVQYKADSRPMRAIFGDKSVLLIALHALCAWQQSLRTPRVVFAARQAGRSPFV